MQETAHTFSRQYHCTWQQLNIVGSTASACGVLPALKCAELALLLDDGAQWFESSATGTAPHNGTVQITTLDSQVSALTRDVQLQAVSPVLVTTLSYSFYESLSIDIGSASRATLPRASSILRDMFFSDTHLSTSGHLSDDSIRPALHNVSWTPPFTTFNTCPDDALVHCVSGVCVSRSSTCNRRAHWLSSKSLPKWSLRGFGRFVSGLRPHAL